MKCETPLRVYRKGEIMSKSGRIANDDVNVPCGKCPTCKMRRVSQWVFRLQKEDEVSSSSFFVTLTYNSEHVPISDNGLLTLRKTDLQKFFKRLRKAQKKISNDKIRYYACGEYGSECGRPHYHIILFNLCEEEILGKAWQLDKKAIGTVSIGTVTNRSIAYTAGYINKIKRIPIYAHDDRQPEFSVMSNGLGDSYLTDAIKKYHREDISRMYITTNSGNKVAMPRYYKDKIFNENEKKKIAKYVRKVMDDNEKKEFEKFKQTYRNKYSLDEIEDLYIKSKRDAMEARYNSYYKKKRAKK